MLCLSNQMNTKFEAGVILLRISHSTSQPSLDICQNQSIHLPREDG